MRFDVFICHASEDKEDFVRPLAEKLKSFHIDVWYDEFSLSIGDSLSQKIDEGLAKSNFGVVVLSPYFFKKPWAKRELTGLIAREMAENKAVILPVWHRVSLQDILEFSPPLADRKAVSSSDGINAVIREIVKKVKPQESPLTIARNLLISLDLDPPPISDEWWLDLIEYKEFLKFPDVNSQKRWIFPLPCKNDESGENRGRNIASTALQIDWSFEGEELNIDPITHPEDVHKFIRRWPGLYDCARANPQILALYVPQITIPGFDSGFEDVFDKLLLKNHREVDMIFEYGSHSTIDDKEPLCGDIIALRHSTFGNYTEEDLGRWYFKAHDMQYLRSDLEISDGLIWLISSDSDWLPSKYREMFIRGILARDEWLRSGSENSLLYALYSKNRQQFKLTKTIKKALFDFVGNASNNLKINDNIEKLVNNLLSLDIIKKYYDYRDWLGDKQSHD